MERGELFSNMGGEVHHTATRERSPEHIVHRSSQDIGECVQDRTIYTPQKRRKQEHSGIPCSTTNLQNPKPGPEETRVYLIALIIKIFWIGM